MRTKTWNNTVFTQIPDGGDKNWPLLTNFLVALADNAQTTNFQKTAIRVATTTPVTIAAASDHCVLINLAVAGATAVSLPAGANGQEFLIKDDKGDAATNNITITPHGSDTINGSATLVLSENGQAAKLKYNASTTDWKLVESFFTAGTTLTATSANQGAGRLKNKDLDDATTRIVDTSDTTKKIAFDAGGTASTTTTIAAAQTANRTWTLPDATATAVGRDTADQGASRLKNKDLEASTTKVVDSSDTTKKIAFDPSGNTTAFTQTIATAATANRTWTLPDATDTAVGRIATQTLTNKTLTSPIETGPQISDYSEYTESAAPSTPGSGKGRTFVSTDGKFKFLNDDGVTKTLGDAGTGEVNAVANPTDAASGWTNGTSHTCSTLTSGSPLDPVVPGGIRIAASTTASESSTSGGYYIISTVASGLKNRKLKVEFWFTTAASQTWNLGVYSGSTRMSLSTDSSGATTLPSGVTGGKFTAYFDSDSSTSYTVHLTRTAGSSSTNLDITQVIVGPGIQPQGAVVSDWLTYTPTFNGFGTVTSINAQYRRVGTAIEIRGEATAGTIASSTEGRIGLPTGATISTPTSNTQTAGLMQQADTTDRQTLYLLATNGHTYFRIGSASRTASINTTTAVNTDAIMSNSIRFTFWGMAPISEWAGSGTVNLAQNDVEYAYNTSTSTSADDTASFAYGPSGASIQSITASLKRRVRFQKPIQASDVIIVEISLSDGLVWVPAGGSSMAGSFVSGIDTRAGNSYGMGPEPISGNSTDIDVRFGQYRDDATNAWSGITAKWRVKKISGGAAVGYGLASSTSAGLVNPYTEGSGVVYAGVYTPTLTNGSNVAASTAYQCMYTRIGNTVTVFGRVDIDPTSAGFTQTLLSISLPIASTLASSEDLSGTSIGQDSGENQQAGFIQGSSNKAQIVLLTNSTANFQHRFSFSYIIK